MKHFYGKIPAIRSLSIAERRRKLLKEFTENPGIEQEALAKMFGVNRSTISRDLKSLTEQSKIYSNETWIMHRDRVLMELRSKKQLCEDRLNSLSNSPHQGSRWLEEWNKLIEKEIKILGLNSPDRLLIKAESEFDKVSEDAAIDAFALSLGTNIIDITPMIEHKDDDDDDTGTPAALPA